MFRNFDPPVALYQEAGSGENAERLLDALRGGAQQFGQLPEVNGVEADIGQGAQ